MHITKLLAVAAVTQLVGCAAYVETMAAHYDARDPCQSVGKGADWQLPRWCGGGSRVVRTVVRRSGDVIYTQTLP
jgi:hypothetical protein